MLAVTSEMWSVRGRKFPGFGEQERFTSVDVAPWHGAVNGGLCFLPARQCRVFTQSSCSALVELLERELSLNSAFAVHQRLSHARKMLMFNVSNCCVCIRVVGLLKENHVKKAVQDTLSCHLQTVYVKMEQMLVSVC